MLSLINVLQLSEKTKKNKAKDGKTNARQDKKRRFIKENWGKKGNCAAITRHQIKICSKWQTHVCLDCW
jgi:hypothetical protein